MNIKQKLPEPSTQITSSFQTGKRNDEYIFYLYLFFIGMSYQQTNPNGYQLPPGMMLVPAPQQQQQEQSFPRVIEASHQQHQMHPTVTQYQPSTVAPSNSFRTSRVPPPSDNKIQPVNHAFQNNCIKFKI